MTTRSVPPPLAADDTASPARSLPFTRGQLLFLGVYLVLLLTLPQLPRIEGLPQAVLDAVGVGRYVLLAVLGLVVFRGPLLRSLRQTRENPVRTALLLLGAFLGGQLLPMVPSVILAVTGWMPGDSGNDSAVSALSERVPPAVFFVMAALLGPVVEELVFRESLLRRTVRWLPSWAALVLSSALFGLLHVHSLSELPLALVYGAAGLAFGAGLMLARGNLVVPVGAHALTNGIPALGVML